MIEPAAAEEPLANDGDLLDPVAGQWTGTYTLTWMDSAKGDFSEESSEGTASVTGSRIEYTWTFRGEPQKGSVEFAVVDDGVESRFVDSWHTPDGNALISEGTASPERIEVLGHYGAEDGPQWGWRTEVDLAADAFALRMYNITPDGQEMIAADFRGARAP